MKRRNHEGEIMNTKATGQLAEEAAAEYLRSQNYVIMERNFRSRLGEIDIIARDKDTLVFIEVRSRKGNRFGLPQETVNWEKQQRVRKMAQQYLKTTGQVQRYCRFDVIGVLFNDRMEITSIELIRDAF